MNQAYSCGDLYITCKDRTLCNKPECIEQCDYEDALVKGYKYICIQSLDTDVLVILLEVFPKLQVNHNITDIVLQTS